jgi:flagellar basal-body rod protein FlgF
MSEAIQALARSMHADQHALRTLSTNLANVDTAGFRRLLVDGSGVIAESRQGPAVSTGDSRDLMIQGEAWFVVRGPQGEERLTRAGHYRADAEGLMTDPLGFQLMGQRGPLQVPNGSFQIDEKGVVLLQGVELDRLRLMQPAEAAAVDEARPWMIDAHDAVEAPENQYAVTQGALEGASVNVADEMVQLIELTRHFELSQRALSIYDRMQDTGINRLGDNL